ncbi:hypothetical protein EV363DRAFT_1178318, partial [Boletus edulis]
YKGSLIGRHFKSLAQVMPYLIHDLIPCMVLNGWTLIGQLVVLLWHTEIENIQAKTYLVHTNNVMLIWTMLTQHYCRQIYHASSGYHVNIVHN